MTQGDRHTNHPTSSAGRGGVPWLWAEPPPVWPGAPTWADVQLEVLHEVGHGGEVCRVGEVLLHRLGGDGSQLLFHGLANTHGEHDNPCVTRTDPEHCASHPPAGSPEPRGCGIPPGQPQASQIHGRNLGRTGRSAAAPPRCRLLQKDAAQSTLPPQQGHVCPCGPRRCSTPRLGAGCCSLPQSQPPQGTILGCPKHCNLGFPSPPRT